MSSGARIDYKALRQINPEAARKAVLEYLKTNGGDKADVARVFVVNRTVVYDILKKAAEGDLRDRPKTPKHQPNKTPPEVEHKVIAARNKTHLGPQQLWWSPNLSSPLISHLNSRISRLSASPSPGHQ